MSAQPTAVPVATSPLPAKGLVERILREPNAIWLREAVYAA